MMWNYCLIYLIIIVNNSVQGVANDIIEQCCEQGRLQISEGCGNFTFPIANISSQHQNVCIATMEVCCLAEKRSDACSRGMYVTV